VPKLGTMIALLCFVMAFLATPFKSKCFGRRAACRPRKMQRAAGQHDNLAGLPLTHACEGRHRRSIASGHLAFGFQPVQKTPTIHASSGL